MTYSFPRHESFRIGNASDKRFRIPASGFMDHGTSFAAPWAGSLCSIPLSALFPASGFLLPASGLMDHGSGFTSAARTNGKSNASDKMPCNG